MTVGHVGGRDAMGLICICSRCMDDRREARRQAVLEYYAPRSVTLTRTNGHPLAGCMASGPQEAWGWIAHTIAAAFDCLPDDVDYDAGGIVTVGGEAVAICHLHVDNTLKARIMRTET